jgi:hypothetical protein
MITHSYFDALCTAKRVQFITGGCSPIPKVALFFLFVEPPPQVHYFDDPIVLLPLPTAHNTLKIENN